VIRQSAGELWDCPSMPSSFEQPGGLHADKGVATLYDAYAQLAADDPSLHLVLAGPTAKRLPPPKGPRVHHFGCLPCQQVAMLFSALDVGVIYLRGHSVWALLLSTKGL